jgi:PKD repeat protein
MRLYILLAALLCSGFAASAQLTAGFTIAVPTSNCNPAIYSFVNTSIGAGLSYQWNFGIYPGINSIFSNPSTTYLNCGTFQVKLVVTDVTGRKDSSIQTVNVRCSPTPSFSTVAASGCLPYPASFSSTSNAGSGSITNYIWDFGDGTGGTGASPSHTYQVPGCKNVTLIVTNSYNCISDTTLNSFVCMYPRPAGSFTSSTPSACSAPFNVSYQATSGGATALYTYKWIFQGGTPATSALTSPTVTYNSAGNFTTTLITTDARGCADTLVKTHYVSIAGDSVAFTLGSGSHCAPTSLMANGIATGNPVAWNWTVSAPGTITGATTQTPALTFPTGSNYDICLTITYPGGCTAQKCSTVTIDGWPMANFGTSGLTTTCITPATVTFLDSSTGTNLSYTWSFPGGIPDEAFTRNPPPVMYNTCGNYAASLRVTNSSGCSAVASRTNFLQVVCPQASYGVTPSNGCLPLTAFFTDSSTGNPVAWLWDFDDPTSGAANTSTLQNPSHTFYTAGCYNVKLTTTTAEGCVATYSLPAAVCAGWRPHANFSANPPMNCANQPILFTDSTTGTYSYTEYVWGYHDSSGVINFSTLANPNHTFWDAGIFDITLIVSNYGCADTITIDDLVHTFDPLSSPRVNPVCGSPLSVTLNGAHSPGADHYSWIILGGTPAADTNAIVVATFPGPGDYNASLFVTNDSTGCSDLQNVIVHITGVGAQFTGSPLAGCAPLQSCFSNVAPYAVGYEWTVFNSAGQIDTTSTESSPCFNFIDNGAYSVRLVVRDTLGCTDTLNKPDYIHVTKPSANFASTTFQGCAPLLVNFIDSAAAIASWSWTFGDSTSGNANSSSLANPSHTYNLPGNFPVRLSITDTAGCTSDTIKYVKVSKPVADFHSTATSSCQGTETCFTIDSLRSNTFYSWNFGDGITADTANTCHTYTNSGLFNITLLATDTLGCMDTVTRTDTLQILVPLAAFGADTTTTTCPPLAVSFTDSSSNVDALSTYQWNFGDGQVSSLKDPFHIYTIAGTFTVSLIVANASGCSDTIVYPDYINISGPSGYISTAPTSGCVPHETCMSVVAVSASVYMWNLGDGTVQTGSDSICYTYPRTGSFYPELILSDGGNCIFSLPMGRVDVQGTAARFVVDSVEFCQQGIVSFTDSSAGTSAIAGWAWDFGDPASGALNTSSLQNPSHFYASPGIYRVTQTIISANGCTDSANTTITVHALPSPVFTINDTTPCAPDSVFFTTTLSDSSMIRWWDFGDTASRAANISASHNPSHYYSAAGTYHISYTVIDSNGCAGNTGKDITVNPTPVAAFAAFDTCLNTQPVVFQNNSTGASNYHWSFGDGMTASQPAAVHAYLDTGLYITQLVAQNDHCSDTTTVAVNIFPLPIAAFDVSLNSLCGSPAEFSVTNTSGGATSYAWDFGNNTFSRLANPVAQYNSSGTFTVLLKATSEHGCIDTALKSVTVYPNPDIQSIDIGPAEGCQPLAIAFNAVAGNANNFTWNFGADTEPFNSNTSTAAYTYTDTGAYTLSLYVSSENGCTDTLVLTDTIKVHGLPEANFEAFIDSSLYPYDGTVVYTNRSINASSYQWDFGDGNTSAETNPTHRYEEIDWYEVMLIATTDYGCMDTAAKQLHVIKKVLYVPNALQPGHSSGDELVKVWKPAGIGLSSYHAQVFDQWGTLLWQSEALDNTKPAEAWDGTYNGKPCPQDVYVWKIDAIFMDGTVWEGMTYSADVGGGKKTIGSITLVR